MYDIFGCASDFAHNFRHLMLTTLNCGATYHVQMSYKAVYSLIHDKWQAKPKVPRKSHQKKRDTNRSICFDLSIPSRNCYFRKTESVGSVVLPRRIEIWHFARCPKKNYRLGCQTGGNC